MMLIGCEVQGLFLLHEYLLYYKQLLFLPWLCILIL